MNKDIRVRFVENLKQVLIIYTKYKGRKSFVTCKTISLLRKFDRVMKHVTGEETSVDVTIYSLNTATFFSNSPASVPIFMNTQTVHVGGKCTSVESIVRQRRTTTDREEENATENSVGRQRNSSLRSRQAVRARLLA